MTTTADAPTASTTEELQERFDNPWVALADLQDQLDEKDTRIEAQADRIDALETELDNQQQNIHGAFTKLGAIDDRMDDLECDTECHTECDTDPNADRNGSGANRNGTETPLETVCALPEHLATRELSANQERARFIAADVRDYAEKAPAGLVIDSRAIKRVLTAKEGERLHTQTVARVMDFLDRLGKETVEQTTRRGRKVVAVDPEAADRWAEASSADGGTDHGRCDRGHGTGPTESVIGSV